MKKIFYFLNADESNNNLWHKDHILKTLDKISEVIYYNPYEKWVYDIIEYNKNILSIIESNWNINLFFSIANDFSILPETIREIKKLWIPTVNFSCDNIERPFDLKNIAPEFDYCWIPEKESMDTFRSYWANPIHLPMAANPDTYKSYLEEKETEDVIFVWFKNSSRPKYIYIWYFRKNRFKFEGMVIWLESNTTKWYS